MSSWRKYRSLRDPQTLRRLVISLREGIYITDERGRIIDANPAFLEMFGVASLAELRSLRTEDLLVDPAQRAEELALLQRDGSAREYELTIRRPDGEERTVLDTAYAVLDPETGETLFHGMLVDITRRKELEGELRELSIRDPLTGVFNRRYLPEVERRLKAEGVGWGVIFVDVDDFRAYNNEHGHLAGDQALIGFSRFLSHTVRGEDAVFRLGGDEFCIVVVAAVKEATDLVVERLVDRAPRTCPVGFALGRATRQGEEPLMETLGRADRELMSVRVDTQRFERRLPERVFAAAPQVKRGVPDEDS